jgi:hypothetical protein
VGDERGTGVEDAKEKTGKFAERRSEMERGMTGVAGVDSADCHSCG